MRRTEKLRSEQKAKKTKIIMLVIYCIALVIFNLLKPTWAAAVAAILWGIIPLFSLFLLWGKDNLSKWHLVPIGLLVILGLVGLRWIYSACCVIYAVVNVLILRDLEAKKVPLEPPTATEE